MKINNNVGRLLGRSLIAGLISNIITSMAIASPTIESINSLKGDLKKGKEIYHVCALCHTPEGWGTEDGYYPQLSGQHSNVIIKQLIDIEMGNREVPTMIPFANQIFDNGLQDVADLVSYIESLPMTPKNTLGPGDNLNLGKKLYKQECKICHGSKAEGNNAMHNPRLQGQHYQYLLRQMRWIKQGIRKNGDEQMRSVLSAYSDTDMQAVADYISRIKPDKNKVAESIAWKNPDFHTTFISAPVHGRNNINTK